MSKKPPSSRHDRLPDPANILPDRGFYWVQVKGCLDASWSKWFDGLVVTADCENDETVISGEVPDQAARHGLLNKVRTALDPRSRPATHLRMATSHSFDR